MNVVERIAELNPLFAVAAVVLVYAVGFAVRHTWAYLLMAAWTLLCVCLLALPGGQATVQQAQTLRTAVDKGRCVGASVASAAPWRGKAAVRQVQDCKFRGAGASLRAGETPAGREATQSSGRALVRAYGGKLAP